MVISPRKTLRTTPMKKPRGILVTIINYDTYQTPGNYEKTSEETNEETNEETRSLYPLTRIIRMKRILKTTSTKSTKSTISTET